MLEPVPSRARRVAAFAALVMMLFAPLRARAAAARTARLAATGDAPSRSRAPATLPGIGPLAVSGPMAGAVTMRSARIWAQFRAAAAARHATRMWVEYRKESTGGDDAGPWRRSPVMRALAADHGAVQWLLEGLAPATRYRFRVVWRSGPVGGVSEQASFRTEAHWQFRADPPALRVLASSCAYTNDVVDDRPGTPFGQDTAIFAAMARREPDLTLWLGDSVYFREPDFDDPGAMARRYDQWRALHDLQPLMRTGSHLATWDDHDYGPNDSNGAYTFKEESLRLFKRYWVNPSHGLPGLPGVFTRLAASDAEFFVLDNRWYRDSDRSIDPARAMFGDGQVRWLKNALLASTATWKFIVSGSQMLNLGNRYEGWNRFERESGEFLRWLQDQKVPGVVLLSGDRHFSMMLRLEREGAYPLHELTCSPSTAAAFANPGAELADNARVVPGSVVTRNNFCELEITGPRGARQLSITLRAADGQSLWTHRIDERQLR